LLINVFAAIKDCNIIIMQGVRQQQQQQLQQQYMPFLASYMMEAKVHLLQIKNKRSGMQIMHCSGLRPYIYLIVVLIN